MCGVVVLCVWCMRVYGLVVVTCVYVWCGVCVRACVCGVVGVCVRARVCVCVCVHSKRFLGNIKVIIISLGTVTASDMRIHHVLRIILLLILIVKIINVRLFQKPFKQCPASLL